MRKILFILVLVLGIGGVSVAQTAQTQPSKEYVAALKKMIVVSGSDATFKLVIPQMKKGISQWKLMSCKSWQILLSGVLQIGV